MQPHQAHAMRSAPPPSTVPDVSAADAQERTRRKRKSGLGTILVEIILGLGLITLINFLFFWEDPGFILVSPHPYWIVVLLVSVRYGFMGGLMAGVSSAALFVAFKYAEIPDASTLELNQFAFWGKPLFFIVVGAVLGEIRQSHIVQEYRMWVDLKDITHSYERLEKQYKALNEAKEEVDTRIISQEQTLSTLYEAAQALRSLEDKEIYPAVLELLHEYVDVRRSSIYLYDQQKFTLAAWLGPGSPPPAELPESDDTMSRAARDGRTRTLNQEMLSDNKPDGMIISAPVMDIVSERVLGVINVQDMPFIKFNQESVKLVSLLADWCGSSLSNARLHQETRAKLITDEIVHAYTADYLRTRLHEEFLRAGRYNLPLTVVAMRLEGLRSTEPEYREEVLLAFSLTLKDKVRSIDLLFVRDYVGKFALILPNTPREGALVVARNITEQYTSFMQNPGPDRPPVVVRTGVAAFEDGYQSSEAMLAAAVEEVDGDRG